jgi:hypothetical protein
MSGKLLRGVGLALIAMPEPFTTPLGVGLLAAAWAVSKHEQSQRRAYVRHLLGEYLHTYRPFGYGIGSQPLTSISLPYREKEPLYRSDGNHVSRTMGSPVKVRPQVEATRVVHHVFNRLPAPVRYDNGGGRRGFEGYWGRRTKLDLRVSRRYVRMAPCLS